MEQEDQIEIGKERKWEGTKEEKNNWKERKDGKKGRKVR